MKLSPGLLAVATLTAACADAGPTMQRASVRDSAGVRIVESTSGAWDSASAWVIGEQPVVQIGAADSDEPAMLLTRVEGLTRLSDGRIVILDGQTSEVRWFTPEGEHIVTRGGKGKGPGEFTYAMALVAMGGDTVLVRDAPRLKHVLFGPDTELVGEEFVDHEQYRTTEGASHPSQRRAVAGQHGAAGISGRNRFGSTHSATNRCSIECSPRWSRRTRYLQSRRW